MFHRLTFIALGLIILSVAAQAQTQPPRLRVLTLNVFIGTGEGSLDNVRFRRQAQHVAALNPDVICLQEVYDDRIITHYRRALPGYSVLSTRSSGPPLGTSIINAMSEAFNRFLSSNITGLTILFKQSALSRLPGGATLSTTYDEQAIPEDADLSTTAGLQFFQSIKPRGYLITDLRTAAGQHIVVANTHMANGVRNPLRMQQVRQLHNALSREFSPDVPAILCGDTNSDGAQPDMRWLREAGYGDALLLSYPDLASAPHKGFTWSADNALTHSGLLSEPDQRVDHIFLRPGDFQQYFVDSAHIVLDEIPLVSDHYGVVADLVLGERF